MENKKSEPKITDHLANERTYLAWIRTSIGIMGFGFVVVKFSLFIKQISVIVGKSNELVHKGYSGEVGIFLVAVGLVTSVLAYLNYKKTEKLINQSQYSSSQPLISVVTALIVCVSFLLIWYLSESL